MYSWPTMVRDAFWNLVFTHIRVYVNTNSTGVKTLRVLVGVMWVPGILFFLSTFSPQPRYIKIICNSTGCTVQRVEVSASVIKCVRGVI